VTASVFLSYASDDREAARAIGEAMSGYGLDVWLDQSELGGGDAWDQKIRKQIRECDYFMPVISARTEARHEGYFRREWRLAVERTLDMADDHLFLLPVVIDDTSETRARVPEKFLAVQWLKLPDGKPTPALEALCRRITSGAPVVPSAPKTPTPLAARPRVAATLYPPFPSPERDARLKHAAKVVGWALRSAWIAFKRLPRWARILVSIWLSFVAISQCNGHREHESSGLSSSDAKKLKALADQYQGSHPGDLARLGAQIAHEFADEDGERTGPNPVFAVPFTAAASDAPARKLADAAFAQTYGRLAMSRHGHVDLDKDSTASGNAALEAARANHSTYVVYGEVQAQPSGEALVITVAKAADGSVLWSHAYPVAAADPSEIAAEVDSKVPAPESD
jgi:TolB-like protein